MTASEERQYIRDLAVQVSAIAHDEERMMKIKKRWHDVNALRKPDRAPVWCRPVGCWTEILPQESLVCQDGTLRNLEYMFKQILFKRELDDDTPVEKFFSVNAVINVTPANKWGIEIGHHGPGVEGGAWAYEPAIRTMDDFENLVMPEFTYNQEQTDRNASKMHDLLGDILPIKVELHPGFGHSTLGTAAADLLGMSEMMLLMMTEPELVHRVMAHLRDAEMKRVDVMEATGILTTNYTAPMECSEPFGPDYSGDYCSLKNLWSSGNSQEFDQVSPEMWQEFCLDYQRPISDRFGQVIYGCCENLTKKIDGVLSIPNLRVFVCSAWTDLDLLLERVGQDYCVMWRQKATDVVYPDELTELRKSMEEEAKKLQGHYYQVVLRELQTLCGHPKRLHEWTDLAKDVAEKYS